MSVGAIIGAVGAWVPREFFGTATCADDSTQQTAITIDMTALGGTNYGYGVRVTAIYSEPGTYGGIAEWIGGGSRQGAAVSVASKSANSDATNGTAGDGTFVNPPITLSVSGTSLLVRMRGINSHTINWSVKAEVVPL